MPESFRGLRKFFDGPALWDAGIYSRQACFLNSKFEYRNPKLKSESNLFGTLVFLSFDIVSCFGFRASNLPVYPLAAFAPLRETIRD
jgi:hypothetical protein